MAGPWDFYPSLDPAQTAGTIYDQPIMRPLFRWGGPQVPSGENALAASQKQDAVWEQTPGSPYNLREQLKPWQQGVVNFLETPGGQATMFLANVLGPGAKPMRPVPTASALLDRAARMPQFKPDTWSFRNLFDRQMKPPGFIEKEPFSLSDVRETGRTTEDVPLRDIRTTQPSVSVRAVKDKFNNPGSDDGRIPSVFKYGDAYYVNDGNHRIAAGKARGAGTIQAEVIGLQDKTSPAAIAGPANVPQEPMGSAAAPAPEVGQTGIRAYHGSPHKFERFDSSRIGTGEGAQAFGHGLYFAESEGVARGYRDALSAQKLSDGKPFDERNPAHWAADAVNRAGGDQAKAAQLIAADLTPEMKIHDGGHYQRLLRAKGMLERGEDIPKLGSGHLYEVNIAADPSKFLDWDKPLSQQSEAVKRVAATSIDGLNPSLATDISASQPIYNVISRTNVEDLKAAGIPGIRYKDAGSRGTEGGTHNYVVFPGQDDIISILRRYGLAGMMAGLGGAAANQADAKP